MVITGLIRYEQVKFYLDTLSHTNQAELKHLYRLYRVNLYSMLCMYPCSIGLILIGSFRTSEIPALHLVGNILILGIVFAVVFQVNFDNSFFFK